MEVTKDNNEDSSSSSTILTMDPIRGILNSCWIGDSTYMILRNSSNEYQSIYQSEEWKDGLDYPHQLRYYDTGLTNVNKHNLEQGYIIIIGSNGLFDNLSSLII